MKPRLAALAPFAFGLAIGAAAQQPQRFVAAYRRYCWPVASVSDLKLAPFHLLATEGKVHADKPHDWHMQTPRKIRSKRTVASRA